MSVKTNIDNRLAGQNFKALGYFKEKGISHIVIKYLYNQGIREIKDIEHYLFDNINDLHDSSLIVGIENVYLAIKEAIDNQSCIYIYGDYDCDGVTSTAILTETLMDLGANVNYRLPDRKKDGYGVNVKSIDELKKKGCEVLITVDNGIKAIDAIKKAKELGIKTIVLDHHISGEEIPDADIIVNLHDDIQKKQYPYEDLAGCGLAFKVACYLYDMYGRMDEGLKHIDLACIGTVADVVPLTGENRIIVREGLRYMNRNDYDRASVKSIMKTMDIPKGKMVSMDIGFKIGPVINASGRIEEDGAVMSLKSVLCKNPYECEVRAKDLKSINEKRKKISNENYAIAKKIVEQEYIDDKIIILYIPNVEEGVVGLISGKITQNFNKPSIVFTDNGQGGFKASGRSIPVFNLYKGLIHCENILNRNKGGKKWGGHEMACGISVDTMEQINELREKINDYATNILNLTDKDFEKKVVVDMIIGEQDLEEVKKAIEIIQPCGQLNPHPTFLIKNFKSIEVPDRNKCYSHYLLMGEEKTHIKIFGAYGDIVAFGMAEEYANLGYPRDFNIIFNISTNYFRGKESIQLQTLHLYKE